MNRESIFFCVQSTIVSCFQMMHESEDDNSMNYWIAYTVPPGVSPSKKIVEAFKKFKRVFTCPERATAGIEIKIQP